ncbi:DUF3696 domain-containing protein [Agrobacterium sp. NPDC058088]|uniref:AAA family ATPase n=1 Tax=Agrobacterium sp. NPDC058088 TaxID=3346335 RepID=UPI0036DAB5EB
MFKYWKIQNFKSFKSAPPLPMSKINILAGANSSGKSTIIQSMLLLKQTIQYGSPARGIALNGPLLRMGEFGDVRNFDAEGANVSIEFELKPENESEFGGWYSSGVLPLHTTGMDDVTSLRMETELGQDFVQDADGAVKSKLALRRAFFSARFKDEEAQEPQFIELISIGQSQTDDISAAFNFRVRTDESSREQLASNRPKLEIVGGATRHFLPDYLLMKYDAAAQRAADLAAYLCSNPSSLLSRASHGEQEVPAGVVAVVNTWLSDKKATLIDVGAAVTANTVRHRIAPILYGGTQRTVVSSLLRTDRSRSEEAILRTILTDAMLAETEPKATYDFDMPRALKISTDYVREFFRKGVRYLGPLRDAPRPVYPLEALESSTDVGYRGEHTAAVFQLNGNTKLKVHLPPTDTFEEDYFTYARDASLSLHDATVCWLAYLGVADEVKATDRGVFGNTLQVATGDNNRWHDLTNVGVGVSQVLPLIVTSLLAPPGSVLIFEQPELHLHPRVQARLADFFVALALDGKQMVLETHSEYLIDRLRLRIAMSDDPEVAQFVNIMFTEQFGGESKITPIEVSEFGAISNWPKDFFDQSQKDVARLLKAAASKRAKKNSRK